VQEGDILVRPRNGLAPSEDPAPSARPAPRDARQYGDWLDAGLGRSHHPPAPDRAARHRRESRRLRRSVHHHRTDPPRLGRRRARTLARRPQVILAAIAAVVAAFATAVLTTAGAAPSSPFQVVGGSIRPATGTPMPPSGTHASLWSNHSSATTTLDGSGRVVLGAIGDYCQGWPTARVVVDGQPVGDTTIVSHTHYGSYPVGAPVGPGRHVVTISLINDLYIPPCDRNIHIGFAWLESAASALSPAPTSAGTLSPVPSPAPTSAGTLIPPPSPTPNSPKPVTGRPGPDNTGVPAGTKLTVHEGDLTIAKDGTVIDGLDIHGYLKIQASNVTVRRSIIRGGYAPGPTIMALVAAYGDHRNFTIEDSTLLAAHPSAYLDGLKGRNFTALRLDISNVVDTSLVFGDNVTIADSWLHGNTYYNPFPLTPDHQTHNDNLQIEGGTNIVVRHNVMEGAHNAAIMVTQNYSRTSNVLVDGNWLSLGGCTVNLSEKGKGPILDFRLQNNRFGPSLGLGGIKDCAVIAPPTSPVTLHNDVYDATGEPVVVRRGV
jgi:acetyltransferase-like isoleucine patch superfamily enzyme